MEKVTMFAISLSLATTLLFTGSSACMGVPPYIHSAACRQASTSQTMYELCMKTLQVEPPNGEITVYALAAANAATTSYVATMDAANRLLQDPSLPGDLKAACSACMGNYGTARKLVGGVVDQLRRCLFQDFLQDYGAAVAAVDDCASKVLPVGESTPLYGMILADRDRSMLAFRLGALIMKQQ